MDPMRSKIRELRSCLRRLLAVDGTSRVIAVLLASVMGAVVLDYLLVLPGFVRFVLAAAACVMTAFVLVKRLAAPFLLELGDEQLALSVEKRHPGLRDSLISTIEFTREGQEKGYFGSPAMVDAVINDTWENTAGVDFKENLRTAGVHRTALAAFLILGAFVLALAFSPDMRIGTQRLVLPFSDTKWPQRSHITSVEPGSLRLAKGEDISVKVAFAKRHRPSKAWIDYRVEGSDKVHFRRLTPLKDGSFLTTFR